ncbi:GNAT family N-acetyltransferase [Testudinibacter sp. TR-2022]|uniref:GNAT family N-acetyltransferase n=1 Tax=Testudinibacter sp. TR-2022 TaxID=2585029 RepID=UPI00111A41C7|nr:GNAT family N-acetyltransferase [Testudinibacter sp. TR-2022]TNH03396.1 GNAT family N-acetyltransferase [Pasteurellaceae bacterium Phil31]TNH04932.1 GNAT family N-acetyltransferase [Testudinibacter sp. TR-2022]TNH08429.1 GNAT family N-acetyltransferase [Testudinibacter sp. TR-2022]TNH14388.1 GNAT family N-acetyltransferase [Testudinibacter sp. TR-2022]TNH20911.1 GNAT family N-acetyltransferase [Testudinibacter sp. TR-2022]
MISIEKYRFSHFEALVHYQLPPEQALYAPDPSQWFNGHTLLLESSMTAVSILKNRQVVGFFILDRGVDKLEFTHNPQSILLRSFSVNPHYQGQGIAKTVMQPGLLEPFISQQLSPSCNEIVLAVNPANQHAYQLYLKCGFCEVGKMVMSRRGTLCSALRRPITGSQLD